MLHFSTTLATTFSSMLITLSSVLYLCCLRLFNLEVMSMWMVFMTDKIWSSSPLCSSPSANLVHSFIEENVSFFSLSTYFWKSVRNFLYSWLRKSISSR